MILAKRLINYLPFSKLKSSRSIELNEISLQSTLVNQEIIVKTSEGLNEDLSFMIYDLSGYANQNYIWKSKLKKREMKNLLNGQTVLRLLLK